MDYSSRTVTLGNLVKHMKKGKYSFDSPLQRRENQWNRLQKSELLDSVLRSYPLDPIRAIKQKDGILDVIDGKQRATTIRQYLDDEFSLSKSLEEVVIDENTYQIAGKKFSKLDEVVQEKIKGYEIQVYTFTDCTEKDVREMFRRQNNGSALRPSQKLTAYQTSELNTIIYDLSSHDFFKKVLSPNQINKDVHKDIVRETLMLSEVSKDNELTSFRIKDMNNFVIEYGEKINNEKIDLIKQALDRLNEEFNETVKIPKTSLSFIIYSMMRVIKDHKSTQKLIDKINSFIDNYDSNEEYKQYCTQGTSSNANITGRMDYWRNIIREL